MNGNIKNLTKYTTAILISFLVLSVASFGIAMAIENPANRAQDGQEGRDGIPNMEEKPEWLNEYTEGIGDRVREIAGEKAAQIQERVRAENFTGEEVAAIAREIGVEVKPLAMAMVEQLRNNTYQEIHRMQERGETTQAADGAFEVGQATKYDYAYDRFTEEAKEIVLEARQRGIETDELNESLEKVSEKYLNLYQAEDKRQAAQELKQAAQQFREKFQEVAEEETEEIREQARQALGQQEQAMERVKSRAWTNMGNAATIVLENRLNMAQRVTGALENNLGIDTTEMEEKVQEIEAKREELQQAYEEQDNEEVNKVTQEIRTLWEQFRELHRETMRQQAYDQVIERLEETLENTENLINLAQERGIATAEEQAAQEGIENGLQRAKEAMEQGNYGIAQENLNQVREQFQGYREKIQGLANNIATQRRGE